MGCRGAAAADLASAPAETFCRRANFMSGVTTHVLDTSRGCPAAGVEVALQIRMDGEWRQIGNGATDANGRCNTLMAATGGLQSGTYRLLFDVGAYYRIQQ